MECFLVRLHQTYVCNFMSVCDHWILVGWAIVRAYLNRKLIRGSTYEMPSSMDDMKNWRTYSFQMGVKRIRFCEQWMVRGLILKRRNISPHSGSSKGGCEFLPDLMVTIDNISKCKDMRWDVLFADFRHSVMCFVRFIRVNSKGSKHPFIETIWATKLHIESLSGLM